MKYSGKKVVLSCCDVRKVVCGTNGNGWEPTGSSSPNEANKKSRSYLKSGQGIEKEIIND